MRFRLRPLTAVNALVMVVVWLLLWGTANIPLVILGLIMAVLIALVFPLAPVNFRGTIRLHWWVVLFGHFLWDLVTASFSVVRLVLRPKLRLRNAVIRVPMRVQSDLITAQTAQLISLVPGSIAVDALRNRQRIYVHVLDLGDTADAIERAREQVRVSEAQVIRFMGPKKALDKMRAEKSVEAN